VSPRDYHPHEIFVDFWNISFPQTPKILKKGMIFEMTEKIPEKIFLLEKFSL